MYFMTPVSFDGLEIDGTQDAGGGWISSAAFQIPYGNVLSKIYPTAGGALFDGDYGEDAVIQPAPFVVRAFFEGQTPANLRFTIDLLLRNKLGVSGDFVAAWHGLGTLYYCTAQMQRPLVQVTGNNLGPNTLKFGPVPVPFVPVSDFIVVP